MGKELSEVWEYFTKFLEDGKMYGTCKHCGHKLQNNATRMKKHLAKDCKSCPLNVRKKFTPTTEEVLPAAPGNLYVY
jgi:hypothetical protein